MLFENTRISVGRASSFVLLFASPQDRNGVDEPPYNPYLYVYNTGYDIHMIGEKPLPWSRDPPGSTFRDEDGFPWALLVPVDWIHPEEGQRIEIPYPRFTLWRESFGAEHADWYLHYYDPYVPGASARRVADTVLGTGGSAPSFLFVYDNELYFRATDGSTGQELWRYGGTGSPARVADLNPGSADGLHPSSSTLFFAVYNDELYFRGQEAATGYELYRYVGSGSPLLVHDLNSGVGSSAFRSILRCWAARCILGRPTAPAATSCTATRDLGRRRW